LKGADGKWHLRPSPANAIEQAPERETPVIAWSTPAPIVFGTALGVTQLNAMASVPGTLAYTPSAGEILAAGTHQLTVDFTPADDAAYTAAKASVRLTVTKAAPAAKWPLPCPVVYGTPLSAAQLNATASVSGSFAYTPALGKVLAAGTQTLSAVFTPADSANFGAVDVIVPLKVVKAASTITWPKPASITYGVMLSAVQLNATASVPGTFAYSPVAGEVLAAGLQTLSAIFTPSDCANYTPVHATVPLLVTRETPIIRWPAPRAISRGTALDATQLNATALVPGDFLYDPTEGAVLEAGEHTLAVTFTPKDTDNYAVAKATVSLTVTEVRPPDVQPASAPVAYDTVRGATQFSAGAQSTPEKIAAAEQEGPVVRVATTAGKIPAKPVFKPPVQASHAHSAQAKAKTPVEVGHKSLAESPAVSPVEPAAKVPEAPSAEAVTKSLVRVLDSDSTIDVGPGLNLMGSAVFQDGTTIYLVMQPGSAGQQNSSRMVSQFFVNGGPKPEIVLNRIDPRTQGVAEGQTSMALARRAYKPISRLIGQIAQPVSDSFAAAEKGMGFSLKGFGRKLWSRISASERDPSLSHLGLADDGGQANGGMARPVYASPSGPVQAGMPMSLSSVGSAARAGAAMGQGQSVRPSNQFGGPQTRVYKGATYVKGADGQWHLQTSQMSGSGAKVGMSTAGRFEPTPNAESKPEAVPAKAAAKRVAKTAVKPPAKRTAKASAKQVIKPTVKTAAKRTVKTARKASDKPEAKQEAKSAAKPSAKRVAKASAAEPAAKTPLRKAVSKKKSVSASSPKPAKAVKAIRSVSRPLTFETAADKPVSESPVSMPVSAFAPRPPVDQPASASIVGRPASELIANAPDSEFTKES
jgi:hypothetical protein